MLLALIGVIGEILGMKERKKLWWTVAGLGYSTSLFTLAKTLPIVAVGGLIAFIYSLGDKNFLDPLLAIVRPSRGADSAKLGERSSKILSSSLFVFIVALFGPWIVYFFGAAVTGNLSVVWYSVTRLPFEVYKSVQNYPMEANLFFYPNIAFYGVGPGVTTGLLVNHALWVLAIIVGVYRLVTPFREGDRVKGLVEILLGAIFFASIFGYVKYFPLKHTQYLIPIAVMVAYYAADGLAAFFNLLMRVGGNESLAVVLVGFGYLVVTVTMQVNSPKLLATNEVQLAELTRLILEVPPKARVVDLEGRMVFWPDGYPVSSIPIDSSLTFVSRGPAPLAQYLTEHPADYIWDGDSGRLSTLSPTNIAYIQSHFSPVAGWSGRLLKRTQ